MATNDTYSGTLTAATGLPSIVQADAQNDDGVFIVAWGTHAGVTVQFEGSVDGGVTWLPIMAYSVNSTNTTFGTSAVLGTNSNNHWYAVVGAYKQFRVRASAYTSGTVQVSMVPVVDADPPVISGANTTGFTAPAVAADGAANPTAGTSGANNNAFNGTTWDRFRNNQQINVDTSSARIANGNGSTIVNYNGNGGTFTVVVSAFGGTTPTLVWRPQWSYDGGTTWIDIDATNLATTSIVGTGTFQLKIYPGFPTTANASLNGVLPRFWRSAWTIGGTTPSFTFASYASINN